MDFLQGERLESIDEKSFSSWIDLRCIGSSDHYRAAGCCGSRITLFSYF